MWPGTGPSESAETAAAAAAVGVNVSREQKDRIAAVRELVRGKFIGRGETYLDGSFPWDNLRELAAIGVLGMAVPRAYGGSEAGVLGTALVLEEIAKGCYVTAMAVLGEVGNQTRIVAAFATEELKRRYLPKVCAGDCVLSICMTEPHAGTDVANYRTNVELKADRVVLNGVKVLVSRAEEASLFVVFTRIGGRPGLDGIGCVLVERGTRGMTLTGKSHSLGGEYLHELTFTDCEIPMENLVVRESGFKKLMSVFNVQRCLNPAISLGLAEGAFQEALRYTRDREIFGRRVSDLQGIRWKLSDMFIEIEAARGLLYRVCAEANPLPDPFLAAAAKIKCNEVAIHVTGEALQMHGGYGFLDKSLVCRLYRGAHYGTIGGGTTETLRDLVGKRLVTREAISLGIV